jgi:hypothetical protein
MVAAHFDLPLTFVEWRVASSSRRQVSSCRTMMGAVLGPELARGVGTCLGEGQTAFQGSLEAGRPPDHRDGGCCCLTRIRTTKSRIAQS